MSETAAATSPKPAPIPGGGPLKDFKDWLSPMLVKELRQGLRTRVFVMAFILMQAAIMVVMFGAAANGAAGRATDAIWVVAALVMLGAMPLRGFSALSNEMRMQTMDMLTLTRLSAFRITLGKWAALYSQSLLLAVALLPYIVIRYFLGGVDLATEVTLLFVFALLSGLLTAVTVGFSAHPSILLRGAIVVVTAMVSIGVIGGVLEEVFRGRSPLTDDNFWWFMVLLVLFVVFCSYYLLDMGASQFAPFAENHATRKRLAGLLFLVAMGACALLADDRDIGEIAFAMLAFSMAVVCIDAMTEFPAPVPSLYAPFVKRGFFGKLAGRFLYPGWHTGILYFAVVVMMLAFLGALLEIDLVIDLDDAAVTVALVGALLFPVVIIRLLFPKAAAPFAMYLLIQCIIFPLVALLASIDDGGGMMWIACPIPFAQVFLLENWQYRNSGEVTIALPLLFTLGYFAILVALSMRQHRESVRFEKLAKEALKEG